jgi:WD40 repeat protein
VTAGCTDGNVYVWDTSQGDKPIHVLRHSEPIEELRGDREREDVGVKFTAWGNTLDRFYTGSSDGVVKVWNVRSSHLPHVRDLLELPAAISYGMFSPDRSRLVVGDASGRVALLSLDEIEQKSGSLSSTVTINLPGTKILRRPIPIILHPEPEPPRYEALGELVKATAEPGPGTVNQYLEAKQLERHTDPTVGVVQGPRYRETGLFRREAHLNGDPSQPLLANWGILQQDSKGGFAKRRRAHFAALKPVRSYAALEQRHAENTSLDLDLKSLSVRDRLDLSLAGVDLDFETEFDFVYEEDGISEDEF